ncbi:pyruvate kinase [Flavobacteriales bacterium]|nr:pyruvate kinase [Flavobacteriales bacterium]
MIEKKYRFKRTKIIATIGPSSSHKNTIRDMILSGLNVCRINFSHSTHQQALDVITKVRELNTELGSHVAVMGDLQGPKLRISSVKDNTTLYKNNLVSIASGMEISNKDNIFVNYTTIHLDVKMGEKILLDDGKIILRAIRINDTEIICKIIQGGEE